MKLVITVILTISFSFAQKNEVSDKNQLDFWIGKWKLEWTDKDGFTGRGSCEVKKILSKTVIYEKFEIKKGKRKSFKARSFSIRDKTTNKWKHTRVDNNGDYLEFTGYENDNKKIFQQIFTDKLGNKILQRIIFTNIEKNNFIQIWESSADGGTSWIPNWKIKYIKKVKTKKMENK